MDNMDEKYFLTRGKAILFGLILIIILGIILFIKFGGANSVKKYKDFESELKSAAENYVIIKNIKIANGEEIRISKSKLIDSKLIYNDLKDKCSAYVIVSNEKNIEINKYEIEYLPYIKCGRRYITSNYSEY
ncbi:MAG: hypothetical protein IJ105_00100 [Bacilli bacterium]|nr:hypothetical protein [Bacilli bacterium]